MRLGIDLGTTRTLVAQVDRGNYPVVNFHDAQGDAHDYFPSVVVNHPDRGLLFGHEAQAAAQADERLRMVRSFKRRLAYPDVTAESTMSVGGQSFLLLDVLTGFLVALREALATGSTISGDWDGQDQTMIAVPAHAPGIQRFMTLEAFRRAGFSVLGIVNEPSAAGFEYTHRQGRTLNSRRSQVVVYDLGGGTFDASLIKVDGTSHEVIDSLGHNRLGGDDFDSALAQLVVEKTGNSEPIDRRRWEPLLVECRTVKESVQPQTRRMAVDFDGELVPITIGEFYEAAVPLVDRTIETMAPLIGQDAQGRASLDDTEVAGIYLVGGATGLPLVARRLRDQFGRRVHRSPYPAASTAIGLAIAADEEAGFRLSDRLSRGFGVFRESDDGQGVSFDQIFDRATVTGSDSFEVIRRYRPQHNIGWYRFVEYASVDERGMPTGDIVPFAELLYPYAPELRGRELSADMGIHRIGEGPTIEERYLIDPNGMVEVHISDLDNHFTISKVLGATTV